MSLRQTTLDNAADRRRFVTHEQSQPYLNSRVRQNERYGFRVAHDAAEAVLRGSTYGTGNSLRMALQVIQLGQRMLRHAEALKAVPTKGERKRIAARRAAIAEWRAAQPARTTTEMDTRLAVD
jgi:hypothetical protein